MLFVCKRVVKKKRAHSSSLFTCLFISPRISSFLSLKAILEGMFFSLLFCRLFLSFAFCLFWLLLINKEGRRERDASERDQNERDQLSFLLSSHIIIT